MAKNLPYPSQPILQLLIKYLINQLINIHIFLPIRLFFLIFNCSIGCNIPMTIFMIMALILVVLVMMVGIGLDYFLWRYPILGADIFLVTVLVCVRFIFYYDLTVFVGIMLSWFRDYVCVFIILLMVICLFGLLRIILGLLFICNNFRIVIWLILFDWFSLLGLICWICHVSICTITSNIISGGEIFVDIKGWTRLLVLKIVGIR